ncbi:ABC transporter ATP-binding protein [Pelagibius litoralis]|uniref:ABC transporter ATP-binding protein n=1 Tax=Pelagibius litoralis TaxID=374515 RepID=A0A967EXN4_9PROT|nr:ABC transporter ATP-binding protein [Pelagibius litoralis]NIA69290.1 ABC transporter ATP-binding protein [Pelagibius litoralis]
MTEALLELKGLSKAFGALKASDAVDLTLMPGEIHALIGPNGAGKSTLIAQVAGWLHSDAGEVHLLGRNVSHWSVAARAGLGLGRSFQVSSLASEFSALGNVLLALQAREGGAFRFWSPLRGNARLRDEAMAVLARVGLEDRAELPVASLSHGERRLLEVALALAIQPKLLLLDEPMAGLGPEGTRNLTAFLRGLKEEAAILLVEHDMDAVFALADRISVLVYGRVIASGPPEEIRQSAAVREAYLGDSLC